MGVSMRTSSHSLADIEALTLRKLKEVQKKNHVAVYTMKSSTFKTYDEVESYNVSLLFFNFCVT